MLGCKNLKLFVIGLPLQCRDLCQISSSLNSKTKTPSKGNKAPGVVKGNTLNTSQAQHQSRNDSALHALRRLSTIASALGGFYEYNIAKFRRQLQRQCCIRVLA